MIKKIYWMSLYILLSSDIFGQELQSSIILSPIPLVEFNKLQTHHGIDASWIKPCIIPLSCYFFYQIQNTDVINDITSHPFMIASIITSMFFLYPCIQKVNQSLTIKHEIIEMIRHLFHLLLIGHGLENKILQDSKNKENIISSINTTSLQFFLNQAYQAWFILLDYYQEHYTYEHMYTYKIEEIDVFEVLQACSYEKDLLPLALEFYDKHNIGYDYQIILNTLEYQLKQIDHKFYRLRSAKINS